MDPRRLLSILLASASEGAPAKMREQVLGAVRRFPGLGTSDVARQAGASTQLAEYHLRVLMKLGLVTTTESEGQTVYFTTQGDAGTVVDRRDRRLVATLRRPMALRISLQLLEDGSMTMSKLAASCGISPATATHHVKRMQRAGVVHIDLEGRTRKALLADPERLRQVLVDHPPPRDVVSGFIELWERVDV